MSKSPSHLGRPGSAGSKSHSSRKELQGNRSCMLRIGERLMRAGSEGNLVQRPIPAQIQIQTSSAGLGQALNGQTQLPVLEDTPTEPTGNDFSNGNSPSRGSSSSSSSTAVDSSTERLLQKKQHTNSSVLCNLDFSSYGSAPCSPSALPRSHASSRDSQVDSQLMQHSDVKRKKEVLMDHLRQKYPQQAAIIMRHQDRVKKQLSKEVLYGSHSPVHTWSSSSRSTMHSLQSSMSPPMVRSMPSSPSRIPYGGGNPRTSVGLVDPGSATLPRERLSGVRPSSALCTNSSSILERRDVKPDEDAAYSKSMALVVRGEGGHYPDSYCSSLQDRGGGCLSMASQCSAPPSLTADMVDAGVTGIPGVMQQYRATIKPLIGYRESMEHQTRSLQRQKSRKYGNSQFPPLGTKTLPPSPHRVSEVRMIDGQIIGGIGLVSPERMSPVRRSLRRDSNRATVEIINRSRASGSSSSTSSVFVDSPVGQPERAFQGHVTANDAQSERIKAMEEQIASLAGLVQHALSVGGDIPAVKDAVRSVTSVFVPLSQQLSQHVHLKMGSNVIYKTEADKIVHTRINLYLIFRIIT
ncbi:Sickle tail protein-like protein [Larimichthys crocea]|uniref:Uncharacterized protein n=1 Tax=Larimichthys crocea TaxID=215358 RepID=A0ACD3QQM2_LARCR|nr:Sickle tail protein-like protein [Larimichthys crocea]